MWDPSPWRKAQSLKGSHHVDISGNGFGSGNSCGLLEADKWPREFSER